MEPYQKR